LNYAILAVSDPSQDFKQQRCLAAVVIRTKQSPVDSLDSVQLDLETSRELAAAVPEDFPAVRIRHRVTNP
jgi:hypothetical protein